MSKLQTYTRKVSRGRKHERGAALITALLLSMLLLAAGSALILTTSMSVGNAYDPASEAQAYYAAEIGLQRSLNILRGNVAPNFTYRSIVTPSTSNASGDANTYARMSNWLTYSSTYPDRVIITPAETSYSPLSGLAFSTVVSDPDNTTQVAFTTTGAFANGTSTLNLGAGNTATSIVYQPKTFALANAYPNTTTTLGSFNITTSSGAVTLTNVPFTLNINQTAPWQATTALNCTLSGIISNSVSTLVLTLPAQAYDLDGVNYSLTNLTTNNPATKLLAGSNGGTLTPLNITLTAAQPKRVLVRVAGYGPRNARKQMQMMVGRFILDYNPRGTVAIRGADDLSLMTFNPGNSSQYKYIGNATSGGTCIGGFVVTNTPDYNLITTTLDNSNGQASGCPAVLKTDIANLPPWLRTADAARQMLNQMQEVANYQHRYYTTANPPPDFGTSADPKLTFVDGDVDLPPGGGAGLLVVTGSLTPRGSTAFNGLVLVLGGGVLLRDGGGSGATLGAIAIARFDRSGGPFLAPTCNTNGGGNSNVQFDPDWVKRALGMGGRNILGVSEF